MISSNNSPINLDAHCYVQCAYYSICSTGPRPFVMEVHKT